MFSFFDTFAFSYHENGIESTRGQASVEGAFLIPLILMLLMLLLQPSILLFDRVVMQGAASEGCRLLATRTDVLGADEGPFRSYIVRRLGSVPQQDNFHIHEGGCSWDIDLRGSESSSEVAVAITNEVKPLPLFDVGARALGITNDAGNFEIHVEVTTPTKNVWVVSNDKGLDPKAWVGQWA